LLLDAEGRLQGHNTDGIGLLRDLTENLGQNLAGRRILVLGAGGATRGILEPLLEQQPALVLIANRTPEKARDLAQLFAGFGTVAASGYDEVPAEPFDWIINASAASLDNTVPPLPPAACGRETRSEERRVGKEWTEQL